MKRKPGPAISWAHPGIRDTVIEYLAEHDAERQRFLRSATPDGVLLALATLGDGPGPASGQLVRTPADWAALGEAVTDIAASGDPRQQEALLLGLSRELGHGGEGMPEVAALARVLLDGLARDWDATPAGPAAPLLEAFYDLSVHIAHLVPEPDVSTAWLQATSALRSALRGRVTERALQAAADWLRLGRVLQLNRPRFVRIHRGALEDGTGRIVRWLAWSDLLAAGACCRADDALARERLSRQAICVLEAVARLRAAGGLGPDGQVRAVRQRLAQLHERTRRCPHARARRRRQRAARRRATRPAFDVTAFFTDL